MRRDNLEFHVQRTLTEAMKNPSALEPAERCQMLKLSLEFLKYKRKVDEASEEGSALDEALREIESQEE